MGFGSALVRGYNLCLDVSCRDPRGSIADLTGAVIAGVSVTAEKESNGFAYSTGSSNAGEFSLQDPPISRYTVTTHKEGFRDVRVSSIRKKRDQT